ncbi:uncharacterized protein LOC116290508 [Actinia tenebrosa]|uniref:Uncharacterized protein LOC116290508 n=1 Tax=Actinia tenebrosa TaxID=6105 RepID=A0A6P8HLC2_ACTTE|nr:uncharacterized protein LOC116290508 [Actinia tenebrosa]
MAFSAQPDHGQNDRTHRDLSGIAKVSRREKTKFVPNPAAKPFVPSSNFDSTGSNKTWSTAHRGQSSLLQFQNGTNRYKDSKTLGNAHHGFKNGSLPNGITGNTLLHSCTNNNGVQKEKPLHSTQSQPGKHIALHLLSKVLDDETIFNFTSIDESTNLPGETFSSGPGYLPQCQNFDGSAHSWPLTSTTNQHHSQTEAPSVTIPSIAPNIGSFPRQNIWSHDSNHGVTPPLSPLGSSPSSYNELSANDSFSLQKPVRPNSLPEYERFSPLVNGFIDDQSPYPSPTGQSYSSSNASPHQSFLPIQEHFCNGKSQQSCESGYASNSNQGTQMSPSSLHCYVASSPEIQSFILPLSAPGSQYNSSPSLSPSSPPLGQMRLHRKYLSSESEQMVSSSRSKQHCFREKSYQLQSPSPKERRENGYVSFSPLQRTKSPFTSELHLRLDECYEQLRCLEKERKKAEAEISHLWSSRRLSSSGNSNNLRLQPNPSRVDKMVIDQLREHAKVETLVSRIERIRHSPLHLSISECVDQWQEAIKELQAKRREEISSCNGGNAGRSRLCSASRFLDGSDLQGLVTAVKNLCVQTRAIRTTVWCAVHLVTCESIPRTSSFAESESSASPSEMNVLEGTGEVS